eukprot:SAG31_NODE_4885_length_2885_cov_3.044149_3_plen_133_part_00
MLQTLFRTNASQADPLVGLSIRGIGFRDAAPTFLHPHAVPSGGDWTLSRTAALFFEGTEGLTLCNCTMERNDGNAVMLSGYNQHATLSHNEIRWNGGTAIVRDSLHLVDKHSLCIFNTVAPACGRCSGDRLT